MHLNTEATIEGVSNLAMGSFITSSLKGVVDELLVRNLGLRGVLVCKVLFSYFLSYRLVPVLYVEGCSAMNSVRNTLKTNLFVQNLVSMTQENTLPFSIFCTKSV